MFTVNNPSPEYIKLNKFYKKIHKDGWIDKKFNYKKNYSSGGWATLAFASFLQKIIKVNKCKTLLDYGSGKGDFYFQETKHNKIIYSPIKDFWNIQPTLYDPAINNYKKPKNKKYDIVISIDVLEHIPQQDLYWVLNEIFSFSKKIIFLNIACYPAGLILDDGRNAHVSLFQPSWWYGFIFGIAYLYNLKVFLVCSYYKNNKLNYVSFGVNDDFKNYE